MKVLLAYEPGVLRVVDMPRPVVGPRQVLAKVRYSGICATDISIMPREDVLLLTYRVENPTAFDMDFLWAGHTMVVAQPGLTLHVPGDCVRGAAVFTNTGRIGGYGNRFHYPVFTDSQGVRRDVSRMPKTRPH